jgi:hypothetical protein
MVKLARSLFTRGRPGPAPERLLFFLFQRFWFILFSVSDRTGRPHSGGNTHAGQEPSLQEKPHTDDGNKYQNFFHFSLPIVISSDSD